MQFIAFYVYLILLFKSSKFVNFYHSNVKELQFLRSCHLWVNFRIPNARITFCFYLWDSPLTTPPRPDAIGVCLWPRSWDTTAPACPAHCLHWRDSAPACWRMSVIDQMNACYRLLRLDLGERLLMVLGIWSRLGSGETVIDRAGSAEDMEEWSPGSGELEARSRPGSGSSVSSTSRGGSQGRMGGGWDLARPGSSAGRKVDSCLATAGTELLLVISLFRVEKAELELNEEGSCGPEDVTLGLIFLFYKWYLPPNFFWSSILSRSSWIVSNLSSENICDIWEDGNFDGFRRSLLLFDF